jgi:MscS family membrane protein
MRNTVRGGLLVALLILMAGAAAGAERETPRSTVLGFLAAARAGDWALAATHLDLSGLPPASRERQGPRLARQLAIVLERTLPLDPDALSDDPAGDRQDGLPPEVERVGTVPAADGPVDVLLRRTAGGWRFGPRTVAAVPALHAERGAGVVESVLPRVLVEVRLLGVALWQWLGVLLLILVAWAVSWAVVLGLERAARRLAARSTGTVDDTLVTALAGPVQAAVALAVVAAGVLALALPLSFGEAVATLEKAAVVLLVA